MSSTSTSPSAVHTDAQREAAAAAAGAADKYKCGCDKCMPLLGPRSTLTFHRRGTIYNHRARAFTPAEWLLLQKQFESGLVDERGQPKGERVDTLPDAANPLPPPLDSSPVAASGRLRSSTWRVDYAAMHAARCNSPAGGGDEPLPDVAGGGAAACPPDAASLSEHDMQRMARGSVPRHYAACGAGNRNIMLGFWAHLNHTVAPTAEELIERLPSLADGARLPAQSTMEAILTGV